MGIVLVGVLFMLMFGVLPLLAKRRMVPWLAAGGSWGGPRSIADAERYLRKVTLGVLAMGAVICLFGILMLLPGVSF